MTCNFINFPIIILSVYIHCTWYIEKHAGKFTRIRILINSSFCVWNFTWPAWRTKFSKVSPTTYKVKQARFILNYTCKCPVNNISDRPTYCSHRVNAMLLSRDCAVLFPTANNANLHAKFHKIRKDTAGLFQYYTKLFNDAFSVVNVTLWDARMSVSV
jgi:hypothetical protein